MGNITSSDPLYGTELLFGKSNEFFFNHSFFNYFLKITIVTFCTFFFVILVMCKFISKILKILFQNSHRKLGNLTMYHVLSKRKKTDKLCFVHKNFTERKKRLSTRKIFLYRI